MGHIPLLLSVALQVMGITTTWGSPECVTKTTLMGEYNPSAQVITLCPENISKNSATIEVTVKHEMWHGVWNHMGWEESLIPDPVFNWMCRQFIDSGEVLSVISLYPSEYVNEELEARMVAKFVPTPAVALIGVLSEVYSWV